MNFRFTIEQTISDEDLLYYANEASNLDEGDEGYLTSLEGVTIGLLTDILPEDFFEDEFLSIDFTDVKIEII